MAAVSALSTKTECVRPRGTDEDVIEDVVEMKVDILMMTVIRVKEERQRSQ